MLVAVLSELIEQGRAASNTSGLFSPRSVPSSKRSKREAAHFWRSISSSWSRLTASTQRGEISGLNTRSEISSTQFSLPQPSPAVSTVPREGSSICQAQLVAIVSSSGSAGSSLGLKHSTTHSHGSPLALFTSANNGT